MMLNNVLTPFFSAASRLNVPPELLDFKFRIMKKEDGKLQIHPLQEMGIF